MSDGPDTGPRGPTPFDKFREYARRLLSVPKKEVDRKIAKRKAAKGKRKER